MLQFNSIFVFSEDPQKLANFYKEVFQKSPDWENSGYTGFGLGNFMFMIGPHDKVHGTNNTPERIMINFETSDVEGECKRIAQLGAKVIAEPYQPSESEGGTIATLADPDGNYFQLATPMKP